MSVVPWRPSTNVFFLSLGSNLGDRCQHLKRALQSLEKAGVRIVQLSSLYETEPQILADQPWFLNMVVACEADLEPAGLLTLIGQVEAQGARARSVENGPRTIDIDILLFGDRVIQTADLEVPHPRLHERRFVLEPLLEISPDVTDPVSKVPLAEYLPNTTNQNLRKLSSSISPQ